MVSDIAMLDEVLTAACLIGVDWGSTGLRVFLIGAGGLPLTCRAATQGSSTLKDTGAYAEALDRLAGDWLQARPVLPVLACGMVGSKHGWQEVPYVGCPADASQLAAGLRSPESERLLIVPGLLHSPGDAPPDLMRGEETQIVGALQLRPDLMPESCIILPGTHSKWAQVRQGRVLGFATHMTGELFAVLREHSVLGRLMPDASGGQDLPAFLAGVDAARDDARLGLSHLLFAVRSLGVTERMNAGGLADYLSGLLIGHELQAGLAWRNAAGLAAAPLALVGEPRLCQRYVQALARFDQHTGIVLPNTAPAGLWRLALAAGLVRQSPSVALEPQR